MDDRAFEYDAAKRTRANNLAVLRALVAAYLAWLGFSLIRDCVRGASTLSPAFAWTGGLVFIAAAFAFAFYIRRQWKRELAAARLPKQAEDAAQSE
ncbi:MAG: hypothetical protein Q4E45_09420 [Eubacteriales bacterium]|nr:hypothetical protein [Eubacteriales bacterium]